MKKMFLTVAALALICTACDNDNDPKEDQTPQELEIVSTDYLLTVAVVNNAFDEIGAGVRSVDMKANAPALAADTNASATVEPTVTWEYDEKEYDFPVTVTVDYGTTNVLGRDGRWHRGKLIVKATGPYEAKGTEMVAKFEDWYVEDIKIACDTMSIKNIGRDANKHCQFEVEGNFVVSNSDNRIEYSEKSTRTWTVGEGDTDVTKHTYSIIGGQNGKTDDGYAYSIDIVDNDPMVVNVGTRYPTSGTLKFTIPSAMISEIGMFAQEQAAWLKVLFPDKFPFYLVFVGNNQAKLRYEYTHNGQTANTETQPFDLNDF